MSNTLNNIQWSQTFPVFGNRVASFNIQNKINNSTEIFFVSFISKNIVGEGKGYEWVFGRNTISYQSTNFRFEESMHLIDPKIIKNFSIILLTFVDKYLPRGKFLLYDPKGKNEIRLFNDIIEDISKSANIIIKRPIQTKPYFILSKK